MSAKILCFTIILLILLAIPIEAKPVIIGFEEQVNPTTLEKYEITNYTLHQEINAISADISETSFCKLKNEKGIRYVEDDIFVHVTKKVSQAVQEIDWGVCHVNAPQVGQTAPETV